MTKYMQIMNIAKTKDIDNESLISMVNLYKREENSTMIKIINNLSEREFVTLEKTISLFKDKEVKEKQSERTTFRCTSEVMSYIKKQMELNKTSLSYEINKRIQRQIDIEQGLILEYNKLE